MCVAATSAKKKKKSKKISDEEVGVSAREWIDDSDGHKVALSY